MLVRWVAAGVLEAVKGFPRLKGHKAMPQLVAHSGLGIRQYLHRLI
jgi:hypothetical protein